MAEIAHGRPEAHGEIRARATVEIAEAMALLGDASSTSRDIVDGIDRAIDKAIEAEREACAQTADEMRRGGQPRRCGGRHPRPGVQVSGPLTEEELAAIDAREKMATPGPWRAGVVDTDRVFVPYAGALEGPNGERVILRMNAHFPFCEDAAFIAAAREDVPRLLSEVRRLRQKIADMEAANREQIRRADEIAGVPS